MTLIHGVYALLAALSPSRKGFYHFPRLRGKVGMVENGTSKARCADFQGRYPHHPPLHRGESFATAPKAARGKRQRGFSLLEVLVAFAIAALALGVLYQIMGSNASQAGSLGQHERAMLLAESLLAACDTVPAKGLDEGAQAAGFNWHVSSRPYPTPADNAPHAPHLHEVLASVQWLDGTATRTFNLTTLRPEQRPLPGAVR